MQKLLDGIHKFRTEHFPHHRDFFERLGKGQRPQALLITCSDSRINPNLVTQTEPGELFLVRNVGNVVPPHGTPSGEAAAIEYAIGALGIRDIIVCGHSGCGAMNALIHPEQLERLPATRSWLSHAEASRRIVEDNYAHVEEPARRQMIATEENVLVQIENLRTLPAVASALSRGELAVHGWVYKIETGEVFGYEASSSQFELIDTARPMEPAIEPRRRVAGS
ncbi:MAG: carbonic anhydrase [Sandaracinaceae bacterium]|nr:carbonic anhydrase [Sandaracinaceae bacterium]